jgi:hypothetical protein
VAAVSGGPARLVIQVRQGELVVHEFVRSTAQPSAVGIVRMLDAAMGWLQTYAAAVNDAQWANDVVRAAEAQRLAEKPSDEVVLEERPAA